VTPTLPPTVRFQGANIGSRRCLLTSLSGCGNGSGRQHSFQDREMAVVAPERNEFISDACANHAELRSENVSVFASQKIFLPLQ